MKIQEMSQLSQETKYELRKQVVGLMRSGCPSREVAEITDMTQTTVARVWKKFQAEGIEAIKMRPRGRQVGDKRRLTLEQEMHLQRLMVDKTPCAVEVQVCPLDAYGGQRGGFERV
jgi:transposase